jgi:uncharacterized protein (TIGR03086 family)
MTGVPTSDPLPSSSLAGGIGLLERSVTYLLGNLHLLSRPHLAGPATLYRPTPCTGWRLAALLAHLDDGLLALREAAERGRVAPDPLATWAGGLAPADPVERVRDHARQLLGAWVQADARSGSAGTRPGPVGVAGARISAELLVGAGAIEVSVHAWDVAAACGYQRPIPAALAVELLDIAPLVVTGDDRPIRFAHPLSPPPGAAPGTRLLALLGRQSPTG